MKKLMLFAIIMAGLPLLLPAVPEKQPTLAVIPFQLGGNIEVLTFGDFNITRQVVENEFTNKLIEYLVKSRKFNVLNRQTVQKVIDECKLTESDWSKPGQEKLVGQLLVADYIVTGNINRLDFQIIRQDIKITGETKPRINATFKMQFKITEVKSGKVVCAEEIKEVLNSREVRATVPVDVRRDWTLADYKDMLFDRTAIKAGNAILGGIYPVKIASINQSTVTLNRGEGMGLAPGMRYTVYNPGESIIDPDTKENLGSSEVKVGEIEVTEVNPKFSVGKVVSSNGVFQVGAICRPIMMQSQDAAPEYPRATPGW